MKTMVFVPVSATELAGVWTGESFPQGPAYAATAALCHTFDYHATQTEDADFAAQVFASLCCLSLGLPRCVLAVETAAMPTGCGEEAFGEVTRPDSGWLDVKAVFVDDPATVSRRRAYATAARDRTVTDLWADPTTHTFLAHHALLWFHPTELDAVLMMLSDSSTS